MALAIFDLDNTLLDGDSDHAFGEFLVKKNLVSKEEFKKANDYFYEQYKLGKLDIYEYIDFALKPLTEHSLDALADLHQEFMTEFIMDKILDKGRKLLAQHRANGDFLLIITATNSYVTHPIAKELGVDDILSTDAEIIDGRYTGKISGTPCFQEGKVTRLKQWLKKHPEHSLNRSYFYSDSHNDLPLLKQAEIPVAVDADEILTTEAKKNGWQIISLKS